METQVSIDLDRPIDEVFNYTVNNVAEWSQIVLEDEVLEEKPEGVGTRFRTTTEDRGCRMEFEGVVIRHEPPTAHAVTMVGQRFDMDVEYLFEKLGRRTRVTQLSTVRPKGFMKLFFALFGWMMNKGCCAAAQKELENLKRLCEAARA